MGLGGYLRPHLQMFCTKQVSKESPDVYNPSFWPHRSTIGVQDAHIGCQGMQGKEVQICVLMQPDFATGWCSG